MPYPLRVNRLDDGIVRPMLAPGSHPPPGRSFARRWWTRLLVCLGAILVLGATNLGVLGIDRIAQARERQELGRLIAERERLARELLQQNRHIRGLLLARQAVERQAEFDRLQLARHRPAAAPPVAATPRPVSTPALPKNPLVSAPKRPATSAKLLARDARGNLPRTVTGGMRSPGRTLATRGG
jgi:hypothetical protein